VSQLMKHLFRDEESSKTTIAVFAVGLGLLSAALMALALWLKANGPT
jgi:hypothetical protein